MCIVSMVQDGYAPRFERYQAPTFTLTTLGSAELAELRALVDEFKEMMAAAKKLDVVLRQPDCEDPEKAKLAARVAELERQLAAVREAAG